jgi:hypothetical protein
MAMGRHGATSRRAAALAIALCALGCYPVRPFREGRVGRPDAAEAAGRADARSGRQMAENYGQICGVAESSLNKIYRDAYDSVPASERRPGFLRRLLGAS